MQIDEPTRPTQFMEKWRAALKRELEKHGPDEDNYRKYVIDALAECLIATHYGLSIKSRAEEGEFARAEAARLLDVLSTPRKKPDPTFRLRLVDETED